MRRESDWNQNENKPCFKGEKKNQCLCSGMAKSQPPNRSPCNSVALISATKQNSQRLQGAMAMNLRSRPDITRRALLPGHPLCPFSLTLQVPVAAPSQGTPPSPAAAGSRALRRAGPEPLTLLRAPPGQPLPSVGCARPVHVPPAPTARALAPFGPFSPAPRCWLALPGLTSGSREKLEAAEHTHPDQWARGAGRGEPRRAPVGPCVRPSAPRAARAPGCGRRRRANAGLRGGSGPRGGRGPGERGGTGHPSDPHRERLTVASQQIPRRELGGCSRLRSVKLRHLHISAPRASRRSPPHPPRLTAAGRARGAVPWVTWRFPLGLPNPGTSRVGAGCASVRESTPSPHPSQKGFAKYSWDCLASGLSRKQYIASTRLCSADEGSVALPSQPETKMILFSHSSFALSRSFSSLHPSFLPFSLFMFSCSLFSFSFLSWPPSPFSFFLPLSSSVCFPSLLFLSFFSFSWSDQNDVKSYILYWNSPLPPPDSWESSDVCIWRLGDGEWESHRKNRLRCVSALPTKISYVSGPLSF